MIYWFFFYWNLNLFYVLYSIIYYSLHTLKKCNHHFVLFFSNIWMISVLKLFQYHFETFLNLFPKFESLEQTFVSLQLSSIVNAFYAPVHFRLKVVNGVVSPHQVMFYNILHVLPSVYIIMRRYNQKWIILKYKKSKHRSLKMIILISFLI